MLTEVLVVLEVQGGERQVVAQAAGCYPHVVDGPRPSSLDGGRRESAPGSGDRFVTGYDSHSCQPGGQLAPAALAPVADLCPRGQLAEGDESNERLAADQPCR